MPKKILIAGVEGYIGTVLASHLVDKYDVFGIDTGYYSNSILYPSISKITTIKKDIRDVTQEDVRDAWAVICLSDLNDPTSQIYPEVTRKINFEGLKNFAVICKKAGVARFLYSSSASVYGFAGDTLMNEQSPTNPLTPYAQCKVDMERYLLSIADRNFSIACMRNATVYGPSPHMRFDLVINALCGSAVADNIIKLNSDGGAWRPFVHIEDLCVTFIKVLQLPLVTFSNLIVNVGNGTSGNYRIVDIATIIQKYTGCSISVSIENKDRRSYQIDTSLLESLGLTCMRKVEDEILVMLSFFKKHKLNNMQLHDASFNRTQRIVGLVESGYVDNNLFWR
jgi:nucleoside-diphosphate-sugar epimerase